MTKLVEDELIQAPNWEEFLRRFKKVMEAARTNLSVHSRKEDSILLESGICWINNSKREWGNSNTSE